MQGRHLMGIGAAVLAALAAPVAVAQSASAKAAVDAAKAQGIIGEQSDGFLGYVRDTADPALRAAVDEINEGRAALYRQAAARSGASPDAAGASAFVQVVMPNLKPGEYYKPNGGGWLQK